MSPADGGALAPRYRDIRFCPRCGTAYVPGDFHAGDYLFLCAACGFDFYQNPVPSAVTVVVHPERPEHVLFLRRRTPPGIGLWCLPGGFMRYGEPPMAAAARETLEEVGVATTIDRVVHVGLLDYPYRGRRVCVLEVSFLARLAAERPPAGIETSEASEVAFIPYRDLLRAPEQLAFPEHANVLRAFAASASR